MVCLGNVGSGWVGIYGGVICSELFRQSKMKISGLKFVVYLGTLDQDGLAHMRGVMWRVVPAKFKIGM